MMQGIGLMFWIATGIVAVLGRHEEGSWFYKGIRWLMKIGKKKGWCLPGWVKESTLLRTWMLAAAGSILMIVLGCIDFFDGEGITKLPRPEYGSGYSQEELEVEWEDADGKKGKDHLLVDIEERKLTGEEKEQIFHEVKEKLGRVLLGENRSADRIEYPLVLTEKLEGYPAVISWSSSDPASVDWEGKLGRDIPEKGKLVCLTASIKLQDEEETYYQYVKVFPPVLDNQGQIQKLVQEENQEGEGSWLKLPETWGDKKLVWKKNSESTVAGVMVFLFLCPILLLLRDKQAAEDKQKLERQQMLQDYPEILSKLTLLLCAGVNLRKAMERIGKDYVNYKREQGERKAYEAIVEACGEMERGVSEKEAYERLGERCGLLPYRTLSALLIQHLQKGSRGIERMLEEETVKAQEMRQQQARVLGEQASTKLLFPMVLMLLVVFVILLVPAWMSFAG